MIATLNDLKAHLNITDATDDALLTDKLATAQAVVSNAMGVDAETGILDDSGSPYVPAPVKEAVLRYAAYLYEYREPVEFDGDRLTPAPHAIFDLIAPYRIWIF